MSGLAERNSREPLLPEPPITLGRRFTTQPTPFLHACRTALRVYKRHNPIIVVVIAHVIVPKTRHPAWDVGL